MHVSSSVLLHGRVTLFNNIVLDISKYLEETILFQVFCFHQNKCQISEMMNITNALI